MCLNPVIINNNKIPILLILPATLIPFVRKTYEHTTQLQKYSFFFFLSLIFLLNLLLGVYAEKKTDMQGLVKKKSTQKAIGLEQFENIAHTPRQ